MTTLTEAMTPQQRTETEQRSTFTPVLMPYQYKVLWLLAEHGPLTASEMASQFRWHPVATSNRMRALVRAGWLEREPSGIHLLTWSARMWLKR